MKSLRGYADIKILAHCGLLFLAWRALQYTLIFLAPTIQFDTSTELTIQHILSITGTNEDYKSFWNRRLWNKLLSWDAVFFIKGMVLGDQGPVYEHEYAFSPLWVKVVRYLCGDTKELYMVLKLAVLLENILFYVATILLYFLTKSIFGRNNPDSKYARNVARKTVQIFIISSVSGFITSIYSEPFSFTFAFLGMLAREKAIEILVPFNVDCNWNKWPLYMLSTLCFSVAVINRPNCIVLGFYNIFDLIQLLKIKRFMKAAFFPLFSGALMALIFCFHIYAVPFQEFCPHRGEWCNTQILNKFPFTKKSFYDFIQSHYWNNGFFKYWTLNNIPNFFIALPNVVVLLYSTVYFSQIYPYFTLRPLIWIARALILIILTFAHVQIINRVASFIPLHLWYIADRSMKTAIRKNDDELTGDDKIVKLYLYWLIFWVPFQTILFACFLPPA